MGELCWRKSSYSGPEGGDCVEIAHAATSVNVRDSKDQCGPVLSVPTAQWVAFIERVADE